MSTMQEERASGPVLAPGRVRRSFPREFKADAVALVLDEGRSIASVARSLGIGATSLGNWVRQTRADRGEREGLTTTERAELGQLHRENAQLRMGVPKTCRVGTIRHRPPRVRERVAHRTEASETLGAQGIAA